LNQQSSLAMLAGNSDARTQVPLKKQKTPLLQHFNPTLYKADFCRRALFLMFATFIQLSSFWQVLPEVVFKDD